ncbi:MAG: recombinase RecT [Clostridia bacterium]
MNNQLVTNKPKFSVAIQSDMYKNLINQTLGDKERATRFIASISSAVATNQALQECDAGTILSGALLGESLNLSPSPQLGQYYLVPFNDSKKGYKVAQFQLGYKGYIQLAIRSGQYKKLNVLAIKKGELIKYDPLNEEIEVNLIEDEEERENAETVGYYAMFEYTNGFRKSMYWSKSKMEKHALKYSNGYKAKKGYTYWEKDFDGMAYKTMLRQLISKWGIMSIDMQQAVEKDMTAINTDGTYEYVDNDEDVVIEQEETTETIETQSEENVKEVSMNEL